MKPNDSFLKLPKRFWASVRLISQEVGYTQRATKQIKVPSKREIDLKLQRVGINFDGLLASKEFGIEKLDELLQTYFEYRAFVLNTHVESKLMSAQKAKEVFDDLYKKLNPSHRIPLNKQKGMKKTPAYLTGIVNMLIEANSQGLACDYDPRQLTTFVKNGLPVRTLARRVDGAFPSSLNPIAVWEIKEYYYTTTFGSRVADGIYESLLVP